MPLHYYVQLKNAHDDREVQRIVSAEDYTFLFECGIHQSIQSIKAAEIEGIISAVAKHYSIMQSRT